MPSPLQTVKNYLGTHFKITDWEAVEIIFGCAAALYCPGEMLWLRFVGASRSGKTEILKAIQKHKDSESVGYLTPSAIRGGIKKTKGHRFLERLNGRRVITLDISAILTTRKDMRNEVFGALRMVKDGQFVSDFGSEEGHLKQDAKFDWILATTSAFEQSRVLDDQLGARFLDLWWRPADGEEMAIQAIENNSNLETIRKGLASHVIALLSEAKKKNDGADYLKHLDKKWLGKMADITAHLRSPVLKDRQGIVLSLPQREIGTDLGQSFQRIAGGLHLIGIDNYKPYMQRLARDCVPSIRRKLVTMLYVLPGDKSVANLKSAIKLPESTIRRHLEDLEALELVESKSTDYELKAKEKIRLIFESTSKYTYP